MRSACRIAAGLVAAAAALGISAVGPASARQPDPQNFSQVEQGHYLTDVGDCAACHTVPGSGKPFAGGRAIETPFGNVLAPNITPDQATGIGSWTDDQFVRLMTKGVAAHGSRLYPAMPYPYYTRVSRDDLLAIRAYLATVPAVSNEVHSDQLSFPLDIRLSMAFWNWLFFTPGEFHSDPKKSAEWNRGAYLAEGLDHCGACHTPKNFLGGEKRGQYLQGYELQGWFAPNLTADAHVGLGGWSIDDVVSYLKTGVNAHTLASGPMAEEVELSSSRMSDADLRAIAVYLKDQGGGGTDTGAAQPLAANDPVMRAGAAIYADACAACHTMNGQGITRLFPQLKASPFVQSVRPTSLIHVVLNGTRAVATGPAPTAPAMPPFGWRLSDDQVAAVLTYIRNAWGNHAAAVTSGQVKSARQSLASRSG